MVKIDATLFAVYVIPILVGMVAGLIDARLRRIWLLLALVGAVAVFLLLGPDGGLRSTTGTITFAFLFLSGPIALLSYAVNFGVGLAVFSQSRKSSNQDRTSVPSTNKSSAQ